MPMRVKLGLEVLFLQPGTFLRQLWAIIGELIFSLNRDYLFPQSPGRVNVKKIVSRTTLWSDQAVLIYLALAKFLVHMAFNGRYGYFRDELYFIICGERLAFGFVDHPPLTPLVARVSRLLFDDSLPGLRIFPALAGAVTVFLAGLIARKLGGGRFAQTLAAVSVIVSGVLLSFGALLTNNAFDILFWALAGYVLVVILKEDRPKLWIALGFVVGVALQNKYSILFFVAALGIGFLISPLRKRLWSIWPLLGATVALLVFLPNLIWQVRHDLPFIELNRNAVLYKNAVLSPLQFLGGQLMEIHPLDFLILLAGLFYLLLSPALKSFRVFGWAYLALFAFFLFSGGKTYYLSPIYPVMLAAGAVALERVGLITRWRWMKPAPILLLLTTGAVVAPFALPVLPVEKYIAYSRFLGVGPAAPERQEMGALPQHFADQFGWEGMAAAVVRVYRDLPEADRKECGIFTQNYGEASAINFFGRRYGLPPAVCVHNNYWLWGPGEMSGAVLIVVGGKEEDYRWVYGEVTEVARIEAKHAMPYESNLPVFVCRGLKVPIREVWSRNKQYI